MCPRMPWELVADPLGSTEHILGTTALANMKIGTAASHLIQLQLTELQYSRPTKSNHSLYYSDPLLVI
jgi:hypothetical protein